LHELSAAAPRHGRKLTDCLIGAVAIRSDAELLCADADFSVIARHADLRLSLPS